MTTTKWKIVFYGAVALASVRHFILLFYICFFLGPWPLIIVTNKHTQHPHALLDVTLDIGDSGRSGNGLLFWMLKWIKYGTHTHTNTCRGHIYTMDWIQLWHEGNYIDCDWLDHLNSNVFNSILLEKRQNFCNDWMNHKKINK